MSETLIEAAGLVKAYGHFMAVDGLDLHLDEGEVFGFLGPNGSGKSTTILMLLGLTEPTAGRVEVCGHNPTRDPLSVKRQVGYLPESVGFYADLSGIDNLRYTAELNNMRRERANERINTLLEMVGLGEARAQQVGQYSRGMKQRLGLADVLLKEPRLVILDDPTLGLDPTGIQWLLGVIEEMSTQGIAVFLSSHQLQEVQQVCHRVGIMSHGKMVLQGTVDDLMSQRESGAYLLELEVSGGDGLSDVVKAIPGVQHCEAHGNQLVVEASTDVRSQVVATVAKHGADLLELHSHNKTLEDIYLRYFQES